MERSRIPAGAARGVLFDYGNVLAGVDCSELADLVAEAGGLGDAAAAAAARTRAYRAHDAVLAAGGSHHEGWLALVGVLVGAAWGPGAPADGVSALVAVIWERQRVRNLWRDVPGAARVLLDGLTAADVPMAIVSNSEGTVAQTAAEVGIAGHFATILDSAVVGVAKPDARIFRHGAEALGLPLGSLVHVGDSESGDVTGAIGAGAWAVRFDGMVPNPEPTAAHVRVDGYDELAEVLGEALGVRV